MEVSTVGFGGLLATARKLQKPQKTCKDKGRLSPMNFGGSTVLPANILTAGMRQDSRRDALG